MKIKLKSTKINHETKLISKINHETDKYEFVQFNNINM